MTDKEKDSISEKERNKRSDILNRVWGFKPRTWFQNAKESDGYKGLWCWTGDWCREMIMFQEMGMIDLYKEYPKWEVDEIFKVAQVGSLKRLSKINS